MVPSTSAAPPRRVVVILGMHRSGTSAVAGCLQRLGVDFGPRLMPPTEDNPRGYYEHVDVVNLHDRLLLALGASWDETRPLPPAWWQASDLVEPYRAEMLGLLARDFSDAPLWGLKDPRLCRLLPWWEPLWTATRSRPLFVLVRRSPGEVVASLARREGFSAAKSQLLWLQHMIAAERDTRGQDRVFVDFHAFLTDWQQALAPVRNALGQAWPAPESSRPAVGDFIDRALSRSSAADNDPAVLSAWVVQADAALQAGLAGREGEMRAMLDALAENLSAAETLFPLPGDSAVNDLRHQLEATRRQARWYEAEWQKARRRTAQVTEKMARKSRPGEGKASTVKNDKFLSNIRKENSSNMRKPGEIWMSRLARMFHRF